MHEELDLGEQLQSDYNRGESCHLNIRIPRGCLVPLEQGRISIAFETSHAHNVMHGLYAAETGFDACNHAAWAHMSATNLNAKQWVKEQP